MNKKRDSIKADSLIKSKGILKGVSTADLLKIRRNLRKQEHAR